MFHICMSKELVKRALEKGKRWKRDQKLTILRHKTFKNFFTCFSIILIFSCSLTTKIPVISNVKRAFYVAGLTLFQSVQFPKIKQRPCVKATKYSYNQWFVNQCSFFHPKNEPFHIIPPKQSTNIAKRKSNFHVVELHSRNLFCVTQS